MFPFVCRGRPGEIYQDATTWHLHRQCAAVRQLDFSALANSSGVGHQICQTLMKRSGFRRFVRMRAKPDNRPAIGSGFRLLRLQHLPDSGEAVGEHQDPACGPRRHRAPRACRSVQPGRQPTALPTRIDRATTAWCGGLLDPTTTARYRTRSAAGELRLRPGKRARPPNALRPVSGSATTNSLAWF